MKVRSRTIVVQQKTGASCNSSFSSQLAEAYRLGLSAVMAQTTVIRFLKCRRTRTVSAARIIEPIVDNYTTTPP